MSEIPPFSRHRPEDGRWLPSPALPGVRRAPSLLLERCFGGQDARWSDALVTRMRRHIGGCVMAVEATLRHWLAQSGEDGQALVAAVPEPVGWAALQRRPDLLGNRLIAHFRDRAAVSLMAQEELADGASGTAEPPEELFPAALAHDISSLALAERRWCDDRPDETPMIADLPAEDMEQLVWTVMALLADAAAPVRAFPLGDMVRLADRAGCAVLARHDEQTAPFVMASLVAHRLRGAGAGEEHLLWLGRHRQVLALLAILADRTGVDGPLLVSRIVEGPEHLLFQICRAADFPREVAVRLMLGRRSIARGVEDSVLIEYAEGYDGLSREQAALAVAPLGLSLRFREKLSALRNWPPGDDG